MARPGQRLGGDSGDVTGVDPGHGPAQIVMIDAGLRDASRLPEQVLHEIGRLHERPVKPALLQQLLGFGVPLSKSQPRLGRRTQPGGQNDMAHARGLGGLDHVRLPLAHVQMGRRD